MTYNPNTDNFSLLPEGTYIVVKKSGYTSIKPVRSQSANLATLAVLTTHASDWARILASLARYKASHELSPDQREAWQQFVDSLGGEFTSICAPAASEIIQKFIETLETQVSQLHQNSWIQDIAEQYQSALALVMTTEDYER